MNQLCFGTGSFINLHFKLRYNGFLESITFLLKDKYYHNYIFRLLKIFRRVYFVYLITISLLFGY
jgi:hypothetical protein